VSLTGKGLQPCGLLVLGAVLYTVAFPPYEWTGTAWIALSPLFLLLERTTPRAAFLTGFLYAVLWCIGVGSWVYSTVTDNFSLGFPFNVLFILVNYAVFAGLPTGVVTLLSSRLLRRGHPWWCAVGLPALWVSGEFLRANPVFGVSWGILGYTQYHHLSLIQIADLTGVYGVSFLIALSGYVGAQVWNWGQIKNQKAKGKRQKSKEDSELRTPNSTPGSVPWPALSLLATGLVLSLSYGSVRRQQYALPPPTPPLRVAMVLGNIPPAQRWQPMYYASTLLKYASVTSRGIATAAPDLVVWPEFAINFYLDREPLLRLQLGQFAQMANTALLLGAPRQEESPTGRYYYNSAYLFSSTGEFVDVYDKMRLVPFAEYRPSVLSGIITHSEESPSDFTPGTRSTIFSLPKGTFGTTICYEAAYPSLSRHLVQRGAHLLVNISNDTWLGGSAAAVDQHFAMAVFRAIENKRYLIRAATAGISSFVDPTGHPYLRSNTAEGVISGNVFPRQELTVYGRYGDWFSWTCIGCALATFFCPARRLTEAEQQS